VNVFFVIYFHNYFLMVFCHFGGLLLSIFLMFYIVSFTLLLYLKFYGVFFLLVHFVYFLLIYITYFGIFVSIAYYFAQNEQQ
jgi:hypothetical protein